MNSDKVDVVLVWRVVRIDVVDAPVAPAMLLDELDVAETEELAPTVPAVPLAGLNVVEEDDVAPRVPAMLLDELDVAKLDELASAALVVEEFVVTGELTLAALAVELRLKLGLGVALMAPAVELGKGVTKGDEKGS